MTTEDRLSDVLSRLETEAGVFRLLVHRHVCGKQPRMDRPADYWPPSFKDVVARLDAVLEEARDVLR